MPSAWMIPRIPEDCRQAGSRLEDAIEGGGMDTEGASDLADGLSFLNEPITEDSLLLVHLRGAPEANATFLSLGATRSRALPDSLRDGRNNPHPSEIKQERRS
jgi:hypothetical protein